MITATMVSNDGKTAEFDLTMGGETRRVRALDRSNDKPHFIVFCSPIAAMYATGTKRHQCTAEIYGDDNGGFRVTICLQGARNGSRRLRVVGWYNDDDPRNSRNNLA
jgi:hypothetical protein